MISSRVLMFTLGAGYLEYGRNQEIDIESLAQIKRRAKEVSLTLPSLFFSLSPLPLSPSHKRRRYLSAVS